MRIKNVTCTIGIHLGRVGLNFLHPREDNAAKRLINLKDINVVFRETSLLKSNLRGGDRS